MMPFRKVISLLAFCVVLSGCAERGTGKPAASEPEPASSAVSFTNQVAALPEDSTHAFAESPFGPVTIEAGSFYLSGLGNKCRSVHVTRGTIHYRAAVCREEHNAWRFIPIIFESMP